MEKRSWIAFKPGLDTAIAALTVPCMTGIYYANAAYGYENPAVFFGGFVVLGHLVLNTLIPLLTVCILYREGLSGLGIRRDRIVLSLVLSAVLAGMMYPQLEMVIEQSGVDPWPNLAFNAIVLWEPLFVFGWLQLRFERAFGYLIAPVLAGASFAAYHIGTYPSDDLIVLLISGIIYGGVFAVVRNLLVLLPITWAVGSSIGTLSGGFVFDWFTVGIYFAVLLVQIAMILAVKRYSDRQNGVGAAVE